ncbi:MAG TPA: SDR family NAD(P)-dependent oxidoreductase [Anaerolineales bacterium]|jgi:FlaA1/EpsC-like NDP-sugar epimerase|nr:SDR family NAD(P)-dependent oxidoreductase [Anaerolineales bacterium]
MTTEARERLLSGQTVLITGGGGTIGSEIGRQVAERKPARIVCLGRREEKLIAARNELRARTPDVDVATEVCDVRERVRLASVFSMHRPTIVFHAAAKKDIRDAEAYPTEAVTVNVQGTVNVVDLALANGSEKLLFTSSTKAFQPVSVMGATKRLGEMIVAAAAERAGKAFFSVRLSNVLESGGGVHALFRRQIESGGPVTVTHPHAERTFVSAAETVRLLLDALSLEAQGSVLALAAGKKTNIGKLAQHLISAHGQRAGSEIEIEYSGLRRGEKLVEHVTLDGTQWLPTPHEQILVSGLDGPSAPGLAHSIRKLVFLAQGGDAAAALERLRKLAPSLQLG